MRPNIITSFWTVSFLALHTFFVAAKEPKAGNPLPPSGYLNFAFVENKGQITDQYGNARPDIDVKLNGGTLTVFIGNGQLHYQWSQSNSSIAQLRNGSIVNEENKVPNIDFYRMDVELVGANKNAELIQEDEQAYFENYYLAQCPDGVTTHSYKKITYKNIYPNIDWVIYIENQKSKVKSQNPIATGAKPGSEPGQGFKYDFVVHPGGNPKDIQLRYAGATALGLKDGVLEAVTPFGSITEDVPYCYTVQNENEKKQALVSAYRLENNVLSFELGVYEGTLVIDPSLRWATYTGGTATTGGEDNSNLTVDAAGNSYVFGANASPTNLATSGAHQGSLGGGSDAYLAKYDINGQLVWATYYGGAGEEGASGIAIDKNNNLYVIGITGSITAIATSGTHLSSIPGNNGNARIGYLARFNSNGQRLWGTYYGGVNSNNAEQVPSDIATDTAGYIYICGLSSDTGNYATNGVYQDTLAVVGSGIEGNGYLAKFNPNGTRVWGTYLPGWSFSLETDSTGNIYVGGWTDIAGLGTVGTYKSNYTSGREGYLMKFNTNGVRLWCTYLGGFYIGKMAWSPAGHIYAGGGTQATGLASTGAYQTTFGGGLTDGFLAKFTKEGQRIWGTYFGGSTHDFISSIAMAPNGDVLVLGTTASTSGLTTAGAYQTTFGGGASDAFWAMFSPNGNRLYSTYYGGPESEGVAAGAGGHAIFYGDIGFTQNKICFDHNTFSSSNIATPGATKSIATNNHTIFLAQFDADTSVYIQQPFTDTGFCVSDTFRLSYGTIQSFRPGNTFTAQLSNAGGSFASPVTIGSVNATTGGTISCTIPSVTAGTGYRIRIVATLPADTSYDNGLNIKIGGVKPAKPVAGSNSPVCAGNILSLTANTSTSGVSWTWTGPDNFLSTQKNPAITNVQSNNAGVYIVKADISGCSSKDTVTVTVNPIPAKSNAGSNSPVCVGGDLNLTASTVPGVSYEWTGPAGFSKTQQNPTRTNIALAEAGNYILRSVLNGCKSEPDTTVVVVNQGPSVSIIVSPGGTVCEGWPISFTATPVNGGGSPAYEWFKNGTSTGAITNPYNTTAGTNGDEYFVKMTAGSACNTAISSNTIKMNITNALPPPTISITAEPGVHVWPYLPVKFTAATGNAGAHPGYQWKKNGQDIAAANDSIWTGYNLKTGDTICCVVTSNFLCAVPREVQSNCLVMNVDVGVNRIDNNEHINIYPNPSDGNFIIEMPSKGSIHISNLQGQHIGSYELRQGKNHISLPAGIADGVYTGKVMTENGTSVVRIVVR